MTNDFNVPTSSGARKALIWTGRVISAVLVVMLTMSAVMKFKGGKDVVDGMTHLGWPTNYATGLGILELACTIIYAIPQTAVLGAILLAGYLGGAIATHVRLGEPIYIQAGLGVLAWLGIFLRDARLWALLPWRRLK